MVVGAPYDNGGVGAAYVYTGSGTNWTQAAVLAPLDGVSGDLFGYGVGIHGAGTIVAGAPCHSCRPNSAPVRPTCSAGQEAAGPRRPNCRIPGRQTTISWVSK